MVYSPAEDSYLLLKCLGKILKNTKKNTKILDMGTGSGVQGKECLDQGFENVLFADIDSNVISELKKQGIKVIQTDLFSNLNEKYGLILFNPPYLPLDEREPEDSRLQTTAGKEGYEIILKFLKDAKNHLIKGGKILLLFSSLSKPEIIKNYAKSDGYKAKKLGEAKLFFEKLYVYEFIR